MKTRTFAVVACLVLVVSIALNAFQFREHQALREQFARVDLRAVFYDQHLRTWVEARDPKLIAQYSAQVMQGARNHDD